MIEDFRIYIPTLNEEFLIAHTLEALLKVFPASNITVIDLGSRDGTLSKIPSVIEVIREALPANASAGLYYTNLKSKYSRKQEWVLWVDGDEIYPTCVLRNMKSWLEDARTGRHDAKALRLYWKILRNDDTGGMLCSKEYLSCGPKLFNSEYFSFRRAWPREVIYSIDRNNPPSTGEKWDFNGFWFWHGVLLKRSSIGSTARSKKKDSKENRYVKYMTWEKTETPWSMQYDVHVSPEWAVLNMSEKQGRLDTLWEGRL